MTTPQDHQEIIIIKRGGGDGEGHHGGAWKIAFADFMTAMMALFLVLWLVNASNEEIKKSVASYFNPVKLVDKNRSLRGLDDDASRPNNSSDEEQEGEGRPSGSSEEATVSDSELFEDPFRVLDNIAEEAKQDVRVSELVSETDSSGGAPVEDAFLDPFAEAPAVSSNNDIESNGAGNANPEDSAGGAEKDITGSDPRPIEENVELGNSGEDGPEKGIDKFSRTAKLTGDSEVPPEGEVAAEAEEEAGKVAPNDDTQSQETLEQLAAKEKEKEQEDQKTQEEEKTLDELKEQAKEITEEIRQALVQTLGESDQISESLTVELTKDGILISITDQYGFSMFNLGSAVPKGQMVIAMKSISDILSKKEGRVRVYGHTDAKPFSGKDYDNWRLSTARAHSARLMLARGGLEVDRISQVVGFADRKLKIPERPEDETNRRIEILLEVS